MIRVVVTGLGVVSPVGATIQEFWAALLAGRSGIGPITGIPTSQLRNLVAAEVKGFDPESHFAPRRVATMDRMSQFAVVAARQAFADAALELDEDARLGVATIVGAGVGGQTTIEEAYQRLHAGSSLHPMTIPRYMTSSPASQVSMDLGLKGPAFGVSSACASGAHAIGQAFQMIRDGHVAIALAGGAEAGITLGVMKSWEAMRVMSPNTCRPFSKARLGMVPGEGAGMVVLESLPHALARNARIYVEMSGFGMSADAGDLLAPSVDGASRAMSGALHSAGRRPDEVGYINAHGTGTSLNDVTETRAIRQTFGAHANALAVSSSKAVLGHGLGAAGAMEAIATALAISDEIAPPTANYEAPDPDCDLDVVPNVARPGAIGLALSNSFGFGGLNASIALQRLSAA
jgi:nodulation protein E